MKDKCDFFTQKVKMITLPNSLLLSALSVLSAEASFRHIQKERWVKFRNFFKVKNFTGKITKIPVKK